MAITNGYCTRDELLSFIASYATGTTSEELNKIQNDNSVIDDLITEASRIIDDWTSRQFYTVTGTYYFDYPGSNEKTIFFDRDFLTVTSITNGNGQVLSASDYNLLPLNSSPKYAVELKNGSNKSWEQDSNGNSRGVIVVNGVEGYSLAVLIQIKLACLQIATTLYRQRNGEAPLEGGFITAQGNRIFPAGLPKTAIQILEKYKRAGIYGV